MRDWALIELHPNKHQLDLDSLTNTVNIQSTGLEKIKQARVESPDIKIRIIPDKVSHAVKLDGVITEHEIRYPKTSNREDDPTIMVALYGRSSQLSVGFANSVQSLIRTPYEGFKIESSEWCILGHRPNGGPRDVFSKPGDSGSCVWDVGGRIGGILTSGTKGKVNGALDTSYVTPIEWLLKDIQSYGFNVEFM